MTPRPRHLEWFVDSQENFQTADGTSVRVWNYEHTSDEAILSEWAKYFRSHYCQDNEIDALVNGTGSNKTDYLRNIKFPSSSDNFGPATRSGDFAEILVADYLQFILDYWVPRTRYDRKSTRNESTKGCDVVAFKLLGKGESPSDVLAIFEVKSKLTKGGANSSPLQNAISDSFKDETRKAEALNAIKQRLIDKGEDASQVSRFQNPIDRPYSEIYGAAALLDVSVYDKSLIESSDASKHPKKSNLELLVIRGEKFMELVHELYERAANEA